MVPCRPRNMGQIRKENPMKIRPTGQDDLAGLQGVLDETGLFPGDMLPAMIEGFLSGEEPTSV